MFPALRTKCALLSTGIIAALAIAATGCQSPHLRHARSNRNPFSETGEVVLVGSNDSKPDSITPEARAEALSIFAERCAVCHGEDGGGAGPAAASLNPKPANFRSRKWQSSMSDQRIAMIIVNGGQSVGLSASMASNPDLDGRPDVVAALVEHIRKFAK